MNYRIQRVILLSTLKEAKRRRTLASLVEDHPELALLSLAALAFAWAFFFGS